MPFHHYFLTTCLFVVACQGIYLEDEPIEEEIGSVETSPPEVFFRPSPPRLHLTNMNGFGEDSPLRNLLLINPSAPGLDETNKILRFKEQLEKLKNYLCSNFYTLTCHTIRHYQMQIGQHEQDIFRRQQENRRLMQRSFGPIIPGNTKRQSQIGQPQRLNIQDWEERQRF